MKGLLRKKGPAPDDRGKGKTVGGGRASDVPPAPVYAKFASNASKPLVSGPVSLQARTQAAYSRSQSQDSGMRAPPAQLASPPPRASPKFVRMAGSGSVTDLSSSPGVRSRASVDGYANGRMVPASAPSQNNQLHASRSRPSFESSPRTIPALPQAHQAYPSQSRPSLDGPPSSAPQHSPSVSVSPSRTPLAPNKVPSYRGIDYDILDDSPPIGSLSRSPTSQSHASPPPGPSFHTRPTPWSAQPQPAQNSFPTPPPLQNPSRSAPPRSQSRTRTLPTPTSPASPPLSPATSPHNGPHQDHYSQLQVYPGSRGPSQYPMNSGIPPPRSPPEPPAPDSRSPRRVSHSRRASARDAAAAAGAPDIPAADVNSHVSGTPAPAPRASFSQERRGEQRPPPPPDTTRMGQRSSHAQLPPGAAPPKPQGHQSPAPQPRGPLPLPPADRGPPSAPGGGAAMPTLGRPRIFAGGQPPDDGAMPVRSGPRIFAASPPANEGPAPTRGRPRIFDNNPPPEDNAAVAMDTRPRIFAAMDAANGQRRTLHDAGDGRQSVYGAPGNGQRQSLYNAGTASGEESRRPAAGTERGYLSPPAVHGVLAAGFHGEQENNSRGTVYEDAEGWDETGETAGEAGEAGVPLDDDMPTIPDGVTSPAYIPQTLPDTRSPDLSARRSMVQVSDGGPPPTSLAFTDAHSHAPPARYSVANDALAAANEDLAPVPAPESEAPRSRKTSSGKPRESKSRRERHSKRDRDRAVVDSVVDVGTSPSGDLQPPLPPVDSNGLASGQSSRRQSMYDQVPPLPEKDGAKRASSKLRKPMPDGDAARASMFEPEFTEESEPGPYPLLAHLGEPMLLAGILRYLTFGEWSALFIVSKDVRKLVGGKRPLREEVLERFLGVVGYRRWMKGREPLTLYLEDLAAYMRSVSIPTHQYSMTAHAYLRSPHDTEIVMAVASNRLACRAYTRVVLRLRVQAEAEEAERERFARNHNMFSDGAPPPPQFLPHPGAGRSFSRASSRAPSPSRHVQALPQQRSFSAGPGPRPSLPTGPGFSSTSSFRSPLFRLRRAPLLRVYVPSPEGDWLADASVLECEEELRRAGALGLLRAGDVIWDAAVGDEGNIGRLIWDGNFLIDLDYTFSPNGDLPRYLHSLAFPPSYFHRVIRAPGNPVAHLDLSPWAQEIANNLQLLQDRIRTETPQGGHHMVVRWVHRSTFTILPRALHASQGGAPAQAQRIPILHTDLFVDPGWYGNVVVEAEGTNEGLADLQERCGKDAFHAFVGTRRAPARIEGIRRVYKILREKSRPGEIWIRTVHEKERLH